MKFKILGHEKKQINTAEIIIPKFTDNTCKSDGLNRKQENIIFTLVQGISKRILNEIF